MMSTSGETERFLKAKVRAHQRSSTVTSVVSIKHIHSTVPKHSIYQDTTNVLTVELRWFERGVKEAIYIRAYYEWSYS